MNDQEINTLIAEACGWADIEVAPYDMKHVAKGDLHGKFLGQWSKIPDFATNLNAMHEAEKVLSDLQKRSYVSSLHPRHIFNHLDGDFEVAHAPARQRAEAFLKTIGKWKEGE